MLLNKDNSGDSDGKLEPERDLNQDFSADSHKGIIMMFHCFKAQMR